jgi:hypothetical protein
MNTKSLNRAIGLAMSALQQARHNGYSARCIELLRRAIFWLNRARNVLKRNQVDHALMCAGFANEDIIDAIAAR